MWVGVSLFLGVCERMRRNLSSQKRESLDVLGKRKRYVANLWNHVVSIVKEFCFAYLKPSMILSGLGSSVSSVAGSATTVTVPNCSSSAHLITYTATALVSSSCLSYSSSGYTYSNCCSSNYTRCDCTWILFMCLSYSSSGYTY